MAKQKERLTRIPRPRSRRDAAEPAPVASGVASPDAGPDLSHIAESLRPLAVPLAEVAFLVGNAVRHPEKQLEEIRASLRQFGQVEPLIVNRRETPPVVLGGNGRLQAMLAEGYSHGAVCYVDLDRAKANALSIALNATAEGREWDAGALKLMLDDLNTGNDPRLDAMMAELAVEQGLILSGGSDAGSGSPDQSAEQHTLSVPYAAADEPVLRAFLGLSGSAPLADQRGVGRKMIEKIKALALVS